MPTKASRPQTLTPNTRHLPKHVQDRGPPCQPSTCHSVCDLAAPLQVRARGQLRRLHPAQVLAPRQTRLHCKVLQTSEINVTRAGVPCLALQTSLMTEYTVQSQPAQAGLCPHQSRAQP